MRTYRAVLRIPGVATALGASVLARLPIGALGLVLILRMRELGGSYAAAGLVAGAATLGNGISAPVMGRAIDRLGQTRVLIAGATVSSTALAALAALPHGVGLGAPVALGVLSGLALPPLGGCIRVLLGELVEDPAERHAAYSLETAALEVVFLVAPLAIVGGVASASPAAAVATCAVLLLGGTIVFAAAPASRHWRPSGERHRSLAGPLRSGGVRRLVVTLGLVGVSFGTIEVSTVALAQRGGAPHAVGPLLALWGLSSLVGGVFVGRLGPAANPTRRMTLLLGTMVAADVALVAAPSPAVLAIALVPAGVPIAPFFAQIYGLIGALAPDGTATESTTWLATGIGAGLSTGSALGGALIGASGPHASFALAAGAALAGLLIVRGSVRVLRPPAPVAVGAPA